MERRHRISPALLLAGLTILAAALRFWRLGNWSFDSDEVWMLRDSLNLIPTNPRPLLYVLNHYLVSPFLPLDEFGLRLLPAVFGVLVVPVFYLVCRRLVGTRAALFGTLLLVVSPLLVYYSQFGRYWSLVFLLSTVYPYAIYLGVREGNRGMLILGLLTGVLAVVAHPASILPVAGLGVLMVASYRNREQRVQLWSRRTARWTMFLVVIVFGSVAIRFIPMLQGWISSHDKKPADTNFLLHASSVQGVKQVAYLMGFVESLTLPLVLAGALGMYLLWQGRGRPLAVLLVSTFLVPLVFLVLLSFRTPVSTFYLLPTVPVFLIGAGVFLDRLAAVDLGLRPRWLLAAAVAAMIVATGAPTLISQYRDGRRWDFRGVARWLDGHLAPEDVVFSDQPQVLAFYLRGTPVQRLRADPAPLTQAVHALHKSRRGTLWIVAPAASHAFRTNPKLSSLNGWLYDNCQLRNTIGVGRVDFRQQYLQIYRCPPEVPEGLIRPGTAPAPPEAKVDLNPGRPAASDSTVAAPAPQFTARAPAPM